MQKTNEGKLLMYYLGGGSGDKNLRELDLVKEVSLLRNDEGILFLSLEIDYPGLPFTGLFNFNLNSGTSQLEPLSLYMINVTKLSNEEFLIYIDFVWSKEGDTENFEVLCRFKGKVPDGLKHKTCPSFD